MRLLILATTKFAPTYNEKLISQINYFNSFDNMKADIFIDASLVEIEKMLSTSQYDLIYPTTVFDYSNDGSSIISFNSYLYKLLEYYNINYIGSPLFSHLLLNDKALTNLESGMGLPNQIVTRQAWIANRKSVEKKLLTFKLPAIVKPNTLAASLGIDESSIIWNTDDFGKIIDQRFQSFPHLTEILIESYLNDATEYTVSITGNTGRYLFNVSKLKSKTSIMHCIHIIVSLPFQKKEILHMLLKITVEYYMNFKSIQNNFLSKCIFAIWPDLIICKIKMENYI